MQLPHCSSVIVFNRFFLILLRVLVPGAPADIKVVVSSVQSLKISWLPPLEPNGIITKYNLYKRSMEGRKEVDHAKQTISSQHTTFEVKSIQSHIEYQFWVTASTRIGEGQSSKVVSQVTTPRGKRNHHATFLYTQFDVQFQHESLLLAV